ncbi:hypothetical protein HGM15179_019020 [Zosterops borbonicus]|uniref:Uncharacterized protein n=1 Tax=Zosterops borbonicus TaxID=364589 RepID=A0A8K1D8X8_9PASS|nr:hypothetical protein HGM15179_019020 [Zosterops borbonicus]
MRWLVDKPIWENQWPLPQYKLVTLCDLVQEQLDQGHLEPSTSPWNTPVFCIEKKSGKWRFLQDLRKVNAVVESMGMLQADTGVHWVPAKCVRPDLRPQKQNPANGQAGDRDQNERQQVDEPSSDDSDADDASIHSNGLSTSRD